MVLYIIGLGLYDERDVSVRGLDAIKRCTRVYLEAYTSILMVEKDKLETFYGKEIIVADRELVESQAEQILHNAEEEDVAFLVVGDPFGATTHSDIELRAKQSGIKVEIIHNASVMNAVGACGLQLYRYGEAISIVFFTDTWRPDSFYDKIANNRKMGLHTLCLLDIKVKEPNLEQLCRGRTVYEPPRYMTVNQAVEQLLELEETRGEKVYGPSTVAVGLARLGAPDQKIVVAPLSDLLSFDFGGPLHSLVIPGDIHDSEQEFLNSYMLPS